MTLDITRFQYPLKNKAYGFPRGADRKVDPWVLMCIHISGNKNTASMPVGVKPGTGTWAEVQYMARQRSARDIGNSAHDYIARGGSVLSCIPTRYAAWNNGQLNNPNTQLDSVRRIVRQDATDPSFNPNEAYVREVECTGYPGSYPLTKEQREAVAQLIARDSIKWDLPITRETVHMHADLDSVNRRNCPFTGDRETQLERIIQRAKDIKKDLKDGETDPGPGPDIEDLQAALEAAQGKISSLEEEVGTLEADLESAESRIEILESAQNLDAVKKAARQSFKDEVAALPA